MEKSVDAARGRRAAGQRRRHASKGGQRRRLFVCDWNRSAVPHLAGIRRADRGARAHRYLSRADDIAADPAGQAARIVTVSSEQWATRGYGPFAIFEKAALP